MIRQPDQTRILAEELREQATSHGVPSERSAVPVDPRFLLSAGQTVVTGDDVAVGEITESGSAYFKVQRSLQPDIWLANDDVRELRGSRVLLNFAHHELDAHALGRPPVADGLLTPAEQLAQRRRMEAEVVAGAPPRLPEGSDGPEPSAPRSQSKSDSLLDAALADSFPASDPLSYTPVSHIGAPAPRQDSRPSRLRIVTGVVAATAVVAAVAFALVALYRR